MDRKHETKPTPPSESFAEGHGSVDDAAAARDGTPANTAKVTVEQQPTEKPAQTEKPEANPAQQTVNVNVGEADKKD